MDPFARALNQIYLHPHFGTVASFYRAGDPPPPALGLHVQILLRQPDALGGYGDTQIIAETTLVEVRLSDVASAPVAGDFFMVGERRLTVLGGAMRDSARLSWLCEAREG